MSPELTIFAENKVNDIINGLKTMDDCGRASKVIDSFEKISDDRKTIQGMRDDLCDKTFEIYRKIHGKGETSINTKIETPIGEINLV